MRFLYRFLVVALFVTLAIVPARAQISFTLDNAAQSVSPGGSPLSFTIDLANDALPSTIDGFSAVFTDPDPTPALDTTPFLDYLNSINALSQPIPANFSDTNVPMFTADVTGIGPGTYTGIATIQYDTDGVNINEVTQNFSVTVVPEPGTLSLFGLVGSVVMGSLVLRRRNHTQ